MSRRRHDPSWRQRAELEKAAEEILRADRQKQQRAPAPFARGTRSPREEPAMPRRLTLKDLSALRRLGRVP